MSRLLLGAAKSFDGTLRELNQIRHADNPTAYRQALIVGCEVIRTRPCSDMLPAVSSCHAQSLRL